MCKNAVGENDVYIDRCDTKGSEDLVITHKHELYFDTAVSIKKKMLHAEVAFGNCQQINTYPKSSKNEEVHFFYCHVAWGNVYAYRGCTFVDFI